MSQAQVIATDGDIVAYSKMGGLNRPQEVALSYYVKGRTVWDLGAGGMGWAHELVTKHGAIQVHAVDVAYKNREDNYLNDFRDWKKCAPEKVRIDPRSFADLVGAGPNHLSVAFIAWPHNTWAGTMGLELLVERAETVIYIGNNFGGTSCGSKPFWDALIKRKVLCTLPSKKNTLTIYGKELEKERYEEMLPEELAGRSSTMMETPAWFP